MRHQIAFITFATAILLLALTLTGTALAQGPQAPARLKAVNRHDVPVTLEALAQTSDVVAVGTVGELKSEWIDNKARIQTRVTIQVEQVIKGTTQGGAVTVIVPGGEIDGVGELYSHSDRFLRDEQVVLFAKRDKEGTLRLSPGEHGKLAVITDKSSGKRFVPNVGTLDDVKTRLAKAISGADSGQHH